MQLRYDEEFVEAAVFLSASGRGAGIASLQIARFHRERERLYSILDPDERNAAFFRLHVQWFREWQLEDLLVAPLKQFPLLKEQLVLLAFRGSKGKNDEGAELYVNESNERNGVVAIRSERLQRKAPLAAFLHHEYLHLQDMVDPGFRYAPQLSLKGALASQYRLALERYRCLWDVSIDGRLYNRGLPTIATRDQRWLEFTRTFGFWKETVLQDIFTSLWNSPKPTHAQLLEVIDSARPQRTAGPLPGGPCPLCSFPTHAWAPGEILADMRLQGAILEEFPQWTPSDGACARCADIYRRRVRLAALI